MKAYTDIPQSKKLAKILPLESADMCWTNHCYGMMRSSMTIQAKSIYEYKSLLERFADSTSIDVFYPAWSLAALLEVLPEYNLQRTDWGYKTEYKIVVTINDEDNYASKNYDNPLDACVDMILLLKERNLI